MLLSAFLSIAIIVTSFAYFSGKNILEPSINEATKEPITNIEESPFTPPPSAPDELLMDANKVIIDGVVVGIIPNGTSIDSIIKKIQEDYEKAENVNNTIYEITSNITIENIMTFSHNLSNIDDISNIISNCIDFKINSYELLVDNIHIGYFETQEECNNIIEEVKERFLAIYFLGKNVTKLELDKEITIKEAIIHKDELSIMSFDDAVEIILSDRLVDKDRIVSSIVQLDSIFNSCIVSTDCSYDDIANAISTNGTATVTILERLINFNVNVTSSTVTSIAYSTSYKANTSLHHSASKVSKNGVNGSKTVTYDNFYVNGKLSSSNIISTKTVDPVTKIVEYGTKINYYEKVTALTGIGYFKWPTTGRITYAYNPQHQAIDIASSYKTHILASAAGTVKTVDYIKETRGHYVEIEHSNGYTTMYAHMAYPAVKVGQKVSQGDIIGYMGSTGDVATGVHCHFVIYNTKTGVCIDPTTMLYGY